MKRIILALIFFTPFFCSANFSYIADIHSGGNQKRIGGSNSVVYPKKASGVLNSYLKNHKGDTVIALGDLTNKDEKKYYNKLAYYQKKNKADVIWVMGNHDSSKKFKKYFKLNNTYYYADRGSTRIIVLDTTKMFWGGMGWLDDLQLAWLRSVLTPNSVIVMHHPYIYEGVRTPWAQKFLDIAGNTPVYAGHLHCYGDYGNLHIIGALTDSYRRCDY